MKKKLISTLVGVFAAAALNAATFTLSLVNVDANPTVWSSIQSGLSQYEQAFAAYADSSVSFNVSSNANSIDWTWNYPGGYDWNYYTSWVDNYLNLLNQAYASLGIRWQISVNGEVSDASNPWNGNDWLPGAKMNGTNYVTTNGLGWWYSPSPNPNGNFWAYAGSYSALNWMYVWGGGYYFVFDGDVWTYNYPGSNWMFYFDGRGWVELNSDR